MKKALAFVLAAIMMMSIGLSVAFADAEPNAPLKSEEEFEEILELVEYEPNPDYDKWTVVYYYLEDISADMYCMISAKDDNSEFYIEVFWFGVDDMAIVTHDVAADTYEVTTDQSGFMTSLAPGMVKIALEQDMWKPMAEAAAE